MKELLESIESLDSYKSLIESIEKKKSLSTLGLMRSARLPLLALLQEGLGRPILLISHRRDRALSQIDELELWAPQAERLYFPEPSSLFYENAPWSETARRERLNVLARLSTEPLGPAAPIVVCTARALMARTLPKDEFVAASYSLQNNQQLEPIKLADSLVANGYESAYTVTAAGQFARRGGILDLWPMQSELPVRLEFFGDELDSMRTFDAASQRTVSPIDKVFIPPATEYVYKGKVLSGVEPSEISEYHIPRLHPSSGSLLDYIPSNTLVVIDDRQAMRESIGELEEQAVSLREQALAEESLDKDFPIPYFTLAEIEEGLTLHQNLELGPSTSLEESDGLAQSFRPGRRFGGRLKPLIEYLETLASQGDSIHVVSRQAARLQELWFEQFNEKSGGRPTFLQGSLGEGWSLKTSEHSQVHLLSDGEIFGWDRPQIRRRPRLERDAPETPYLDLQNGDLVVHIDHGIGVFKGLVQRQVEGVEREFLQVNYAQDDQLYVPVHQADRLTSYVGSRGERPNLSRLGGVEWQTVKGRVKKAVEAIAEDLLELYANRKLVSGRSFGKDTPWQHELEASFPYVETEDQLRVIEEVKRDMESARPMDRLVCGDAGYGKTEVALRAAFKAVMDGKQVALLVPTTVLAQQHFETFRQRLAAFPVQVEMLSRFRTAKEQGAIIERLGSGDLDIVIGTHRLVQSDVEFKDLGLVIIDEEQRFGVTHKEHLKKLRTEVDVLTMTATPIPRTLYMALTGVRDISTISTPPEERLPVVTHVGPYSPKLVRQAVLREMDRGGQVFFVHNRVQTIGAMQQRLNVLVPEARISIAHGQMPERDLAKRMMQFSAGEIDILLTTTIIESGLDIPNANTLIIDRADAFGLAQLYQLRGRVGRAAQRAYAYFFRHAQRKASEEGRQRLETIAENTQLGAGFSVAMRDLEIRGAGDLLGTRQHGLIAAVGFHLYTRLLTKAVDEIRKLGKLNPDSAATQIVLYHPIINVDLPLEIGIPSNYVPDKSMRLRMYRRLADLHDLSEIDALKEEFADRFGKPPEEVLNLLFQLKVKVLAEAAGLISISGESGRLAMRFPIPADEKAQRQFPALGENVRASKNTAWLYGLEEESWKEALVETLEALAAGSSLAQPA
jgi:transcription-repair coupling factor (superfamily II helicase)